MQAWLVTGGAGFIGSNFVRQALKNNDLLIVNLDKLTYAGNRESLFDLMDDPNHVFIHGGIENGVLVAELLRRFKIEAVVNMAAESHVDRSIDAPAAFIQTNIMGTFNLLETVHRYWEELASDRKNAFRFLHISTDEVYGTLGKDGLFSECTAYAPNSPYAASKASSDHLVRAYHHTYGLPTLTTNCSNNYGPYQFPEKLIPLMILNALEGKNLPIYGNGQNIRDWLFVEDHCRALLTVLDKGSPGEVYNIGSYNEKTNLEVVYAICDVLDEIHPCSGSRSYRDQISFVIDRPGHDLRYAINASKITREFGWQPQETFETGIRKTLQWYLENIPWCQRVQDGSYRLERLGLAK